MKSVMTLSKKAAFLPVILLLLMLYGCAPSTTSKANPSATEEDVFAPDRPPTAQTLYFMADLHLKQGHPLQAEQVYRRIIHEYPDFLIAYNELSALLMSQRRIPEAMGTLRMALEVNPRDPVLLNNMGMCWLIRKNYEKALEYFTDAAGLIPENTRYRSNMATALVLLGRSDEALALYRQILPADQAEENIRILQENIESLKE